MYFFTSRLPMVLNVSWPEGDEVKEGDILKAGQRIGELCELCRVCTLYFKYYGVVYTVICSLYTN